MIPARCESEYTPPKCAVDTDCFIRLVLDGARAGLVDEPLARYRLRDGSLSSDRARSLLRNIEIREL